MKELLILVIVMILTSIAYYVGGYDPIAQENVCHHSHMDAVDGVSGVTCIPSPGIKN